MRGGEIVMDNKEEEEPMAPLDDTSDIDLEYLVEGEALVTRHVLNTQVKEDDIKQQRENIFHTCCHVQNKVCILIIDGESCANVASVLLVEKLQLPTLKHPRPYKLQWLSDSGEVRSEGAKASVSIFLHREVS